MRLLSRGGAELRYYAACMLPASAFIAGGDGRAAFVGPTVLLVCLLLTRTSASNAAWLAADADCLTAHFSIRASERIPLAAIGAVDVRLSPLGRLLPWTASFLSVFRRDVPGVVEIRARTWQVEAFLVTLAHHARRAGVSGLGTFAVPRRHYALDLLPVVPATAIVFLFPFAVSWSSFALALGVFVLWSAWGWLRFEKLKTAVEAGETPATMRAWLELLRGA